MFSHYLKTHLNIMCHEKNRFVTKSFEDQFLKYIRTDICINCTQRIIEKINVSEMTDTAIFNLVNL